MADCIKATDFDPTGVLGELKKTFSISLDNDYESIVLLSRGIINQGHAIVTRTVMDNESSDAIVDVRILRNENRADLLRHLTVCSIIWGTEGRRGVGVFVSLDVHLSYLVTLAEVSTFRARIICQDGQAGF